jgi:hypothetical protein
VSGLQEPEWPLDVVGAPAAGPYAWAEVWEVQPDGSAARVGVVAASLDRTTAAVWPMGVPSSPTQIEMDANVRNARTLDGYDPQTMIAALAESYPGTGTIQVGDLHLSPSRADLYLEATDT